MVIRSVNLETVCGPSSVLPKNVYPEYAVYGRSNVGKSSLINGIMRRKNYARTSSEPGKTQTINYYNINNELFLVDLPGYGYAKTSISERKKWDLMIEKYLSTSKKLKFVCLLVDIRHKPSEKDVEMYNMLKEMNIMAVVIATKADKIKRSLLEKNLRVIKESLDMEKDADIIVWSSKTKQGLTKIDELLTLTQTS